MPGGPGADHHERAPATCYRHPGREAPLACSRCGRPICLDDAVDAPVGYLCPECARLPSRVRRAQRAGDFPLTRILLGALVVGYLLDLGVGMFQPGALFGPAVAAGEWWRIVTSGFLHAGLIHIGFNGYLLYMLGQMLEPSMGSLRFGAVYAAGLFGGAAGALLLTFNAATIGASGAVFGLMGAAMVGLRRQGINPWRSSIGSLVILNLVFTFVVPSISIGGHVGGLLGGAAAAVPVIALATGEQRRTGTILAWSIAAALGALSLFFGSIGPVFS